MQSRQGGHFDSVDDFDRGMLQKNLAEGGFRAEGFDPGEEASTKTNATYL
jgi:hypothetical protein